MTLGRIVVGLVSVVLGALLPSVAPWVATALSRLDQPLIGGATALIIGSVVGIGSKQMLFFASLESSLATVLWSVTAAILVIGVWLLVGIVAFELVQRLFCRNWAPLLPLINRDLVGLFAMPSAMVAGAVQTLSGAGRYDGRRVSASSVGFALLVRFVAFAVLVLITGVFWLYVQNFAGRWPAVLLCFA